MVKVLKNRPKSKYNPLEKILRAHKTLLREESSLTTLKGALTGHVLPTDKTIAALREESKLCERNLAARLKLLERIARRNDYKLPNALHVEWQKLTNKTHELGNLGRIAAAQGKTKNGKVRTALEEHATRMKVFYDHAEQRLIQRGLTFARLEVREAV